jgi:8-oxo-dGTP pyrophosphatase MutT (NUDIX family)
MSTSAQQSGNALGQIYLAARAGLARELFEETGINVRETPDRLRPVVLRETQKTDKSGKELLPNEYKHRLFFALQVTDQDFFEVRVA